jgi:predicted ATPase
MITEIQVNNFRNLQNVFLSTKRFTLLMGANGSGKSGIIHSMLIMKQTFLNEDAPDSLEFVGEMINLGSRREVVYRHDESNEIEIGIKANWQYDESQTRSFSYSAKSGRAGYTHQLQIKIGQFEMGVFPDSPRPRYYFLDGERRAKGVRARNERGLGFDGQILDDEFSAYSQFFGTKMVADVFRNMFFVPIPRGIAEFKTSIPSRKSHQLETSRGLSELTQNLLSMITYDNDLVDRISPYMRRLFGKNIRPASLPDNLGVSQRAGYPSAGHAGTADFYDSDVRSYASNTGFGLNQVLFMLAQIIDCPRGSTILIEEPEISLHPAIQYELANILMELATQGDKQLIMTTHSEHMVFAFFKAVEDKKLQADDLAVCSFRNEEGNSDAIVEPVKNLQASMRDFLGDNKELISLYKKALGMID